MPKSDIQPKVITNFQARPATELQRKLWRAWWTRLIASVRKELESEAKGK
ncbi:hypothetical protein ACFLVS_04190 [Chloroflexota bacterium]